MQAPERLAKAQDEVDRVLGDARIASPSMLKDLRYTVACFSESLPLWPVVPEGSSRGPRFNQAARSISNIAVLRSKAWGADSETSSPERWLDNSTKAQDIRKIRSCPGRPFAEQEAKIVLATVLRNFDFTPVQIPPLGQEMVYHVLARPRDGVHVRAHRR